MSTPDRINRLILESQERPKSYCFSLSPTLHNELQTLAKTHSLSMSALVTLAVKFLIEELADEGENNDRS